MEESKYSSIHTKESKKNSYRRNDTTATAIVLVNDWLGQPEIEEWELQKEQRAEEDAGGMDDDLYQ